MRDILVFFVLICAIHSHSVGNVMISWFESHWVTTDRVISTGCLPVAWHQIMMTSSNGNIFRVTGPLYGELTGPGNSPHKGQWRGALMFSLIYAWINDWVNNREAGDLRRQRDHYDVIVMNIQNQNHKNAWYILHYLCNSNLLRVMMNHVRNLFISASTFNNSSGNQLWYVVCGLVLVNRGPCIGLLPDSTKLSSEAIITVASWWARWRLKSPASQLFTWPFIQAQIKENIKAPHQWPFLGELPGDRWIPRTKGQ